MKKRREGAAEVIGAAIRDRTRGDIYWWLWDEEPALTAAKRAGRRIAWAAMAERIGKLGLKDGAGKTDPTPEALRKTFWRVCKAKRLEAEARGDRAAKRKPPVTNAPPPTAQPDRLVRKMPESDAPAGPLPPNERLADLRREILKRSFRNVG